MSLFALAVSILVAVLAGAVFAAAPARGHASSFSDVSESSYAHESVEYLAAAEVLSGYPDGTFRPAALLNRGQAAKMLASQQGLTVAQSVTTRRFSDIESVFGPYVEAAAAEGWINGYPDGTFRTYDSLQRQHMAVIMVRSQGWEAEAQGLSASRVGEILGRFTDREGISSNSRRYVALAVEKGLFEGDEQERLNPAEGISRAQFGAVVYRAELRDVTIVEGIRVGTDHEDKTRVVLDLSRAPDGGVNADMAGSSVLVVDMPGAVVLAGGSDSAVGSAEVDTVAVRQPDYRPPSVRVTLTLKRFSRFEVTTIEPSDNRGHRIVIDVSGRTDGPDGSGGPLIALDAGHGGKDSGAVGTTGTLEKDINLEVTKIADGALRKAGIRTLLTRTDDSFVSLESRASLANQAKASLFVSIHNNAAGDPDSEGTETFYWGTSGGSYSVEGKRLAEAIQRNLVHTLESYDRKARIHWQSLHVLRETNMPAALAEVGFLTNAEEEAKLKDPEYRRLAGEAIARGVLEYLGWVSPLPPLSSEDADAEDSSSGTSTTTSTTSTTTTSTSTSTTAPTTTTTSESDAPAVGGGS